MSYQVSGAEHTAGFQNGTWTGRSTLFSYERATFPAGLLTLVYSHLQQRGHRVQLLRKPAPEPRGGARPIVNKFGYSDEYAYQYDCVDSLVRHRQIVAQIATGGGKSNIAAIAVARIKRPTLFLTTRTVLMHQMRRSFEESLAYRAAHGEPECASMKVGVMGDDEFTPRKMLNVAMVQTIKARLDSPDSKVREAMTKILELFELVILEEAHESSGDGYYHILNKCKNAVYRLALTATPFMKEDEEANMRLMAVSGPVGIRVSEKDLIDKGILATPKFKFLNAPRAPEVRKSSSWPRSYNYGILHNVARNRLIVLEARRFARLKLSTMILIQRKEHGRLLLKQLSELGVRSRFIFGESTQSERETALGDLQRGKLDVLIGSTILDVGVDVPAIGAVILAGGGKAEVAHRQRIGRGLRRKARGVPNLAFIVDFYDGGNKHLEMHSIQRRQIVESTPGFAENILRDGADFDFDAFERIAA